MNYHKIEKLSTSNGVGIRVVLWVSGCSLHCNGCHNPQTWDFKSGKLFDQNAKNELFDAINKPYIQGVTISGGNPTSKENVEDVICLIKEIKSTFPTKDVWVYSGYTIEELYYHGVSRILLYTDVLVDGRYVEDQRDITLQFCGSRNQRLIDVKETLMQGTIVQYKINK